MSDKDMMVPTDQIQRFCKRWQVRELSLFGSILGADFRADSDVDVLVELAPDAACSLYDWVDMIDDLKGIFGRPVDLVEKCGLTNPFRRREILHHRQVIYEA